MADQEAANWIKEHSQHLEKLKDWLNTEVKIVEMGTKRLETYNGDIRELIERLSVMLPWICDFIKKIQNGEEISNVVAFIRDTVLPYDEVYIIDEKGENLGRRVDTHEKGNQIGRYVHTLTAYKNTDESVLYYENLNTLCEKIMNLDTDELKALHDMLCSHNDRNQSLFDRTAWGMLIEQNRAEKGHVLFYKRPNIKPEDRVGGPWVKSSSSGGKRTKRHKRSGHKKRSSKRSSKRSGHKRSGHKSRRR